MRGVGSRLAALQIRGPWASTATTVTASYWAATSLHGWLAAMLLAAANVVSAGLIVAEVLASNGITVNLSLALTEDMERPLQVRSVHKNRDTKYN